MAAKSQNHYAVERSPGEGGDSGWAGGRAGGEGGAGLAEAEEGWQRLTSDGSVLTGRRPSADIAFFVLLRFSLSLSNF